LADGTPHLGRVEDRFDFRNPNYPAVFKARAERLAQIRARPAVLEALRLHYKHNPDDFINDWGCTFEVRNPERGLPALVPFILFPKQREWVRKVMVSWRSGKPLITEKSRDCGLSWLSVALGCTLCLFWEGLNIGYGSRKEEYVDKIGVPKALFERGRQFLRYLPGEFTSRPCANAPEWTSAHMRIMFGATGSTMTGEAGDNIGRGDRASIYFTDEEAFLERPALVEASLSQTTNCRVSISTPNGMANPFAQKRWGGKIEVFTFHWRDDPRKDEAWYAKQVDELDPVTLAQEVDLDYSASVEGVLIPSAWVQSAIDAHVKLSLDITGETRAALDVADEGIDTNALAAGKGILLSYLVEWSGKGEDIFKTTQRAFGHCDEADARFMLYDADGLGAGVRGDARVINESRAGRQITIAPFRGSGAVDRSEAQDVKGRVNKDFFANAKAQAWWLLRLRFERTHRAIQELAAGGYPQFDPDDLIAIDGRLPVLGKLQQELSQPTYSLNSVGKIVVDKKPDGTKSPNLADSVMIRYSQSRRTMRISREALQSA
jgi:hypothetical protein